MVGVPPFFRWRLRPVVAHILADLELAQPLNHERPDQQPDQQRRQAGKHRAKGQIPEDAEDPEVGKQLLVQQPIEQSAPAFTRAAVPAAH
jgi:hypothetical protein